MAAPSPTTRVAPVGIRLEDGFPTLVTFSADPDISLWEVGVKPTGDDAGDPIPTTTMWNVRYRTKAARALIDNDDITFRAAYDPAAKTQIRAILGVENVVTVTLPDGSTEAVYGFLRKSEWAEHVEGEMPIGTFTVTVTNWDYQNRVEAGPSVVSVAGT